jgi:hypothetical protein
MRTAATVGDDQNGNGDENRCDTLQHGVFPF